LLGVAAVLVVLGFGLYLAAITMLGHRFYVAGGTVVVPPAVVRHVGAPALLCSGHGGPLETSGVYGAPLGRDLERKPRAFCKVPSTPMSFEYEESVYTSHFPRRMHVYVWLERHPELEGLCANHADPVVELEARYLKGNGSPTPSDWPCFRPNARGGLGYAVVFERSVPGDREARQVELSVAGYP
jgi:hypothetical protein